MALLWNQAAGSINLEFISYWNSGVLAAPDNHLTTKSALLCRNSGAVWRQEMPFNDYRTF
ncbi:putative cobalamin synthesis protein [Escherichia coli]|nr:putative cobalamin synthesis protein [Escherichia coli]